jgi:ABC-type glycerol-3-phosphate transport system permease component
VKAVRLQRYLARCGIASRRKAEQLITGGQVRVDGQVVDELGARVDPEHARVTVAGKPVHPEETMYILFNKLGLTTTRFSVVLAYTTFSLPLVVWILRGFFEDLPRELEESAWVDGASRHAAFALVVLPLIRPGLVAASILCLQLAWNDFLFAAVLTSNATRTLPVLMAAFSGGDTGVDWGGMTASGVLVILPVILFSFAAQRHLVAGLSSGAVKG